MDLNIEGINGPILVRKHLENKAVIKTTVSLSDNADEILEFSMTKFNFSENK